MDYPALSPLPVKGDAPILISAASVKIMRAFFFFPLPLFCPDDYFLPYC